ncbi:DNA ligase 1-like [Helianthus annuus]|uniref:DNA ligase 1-like n=1 Tax=Helianthus annuus TaxID=4232 RepID=UPI0016533FD9|nr:DNA ligase 1-like [Helianthus annuus]
MAKIVPVDESEATVDDAKVEKKTEAEEDKADQTSDADKEKPKSEHELEDDEKDEIIKRLGAQLAALMANSEKSTGEKHLRMLEESNSDDEKVKKKKKKIKTPVSNDDEEVPVIKRKVKEVPAFKVDVEADAKNIPVICENCEIIKKKNSELINNMNRLKESYDVLNKAMNMIYPTVEGMKAFEEDTSEEKKIDTGEKTSEKKNSEKKTCTKVKNSGVGKG